MLLIATLKLSAQQLEGIVVYSQDRNYESPGVEKERCSYRLVGKRMVINDTMVMQTFTRKGIMVKNTATAFSDVYINTKTKKLYYKERNPGINLQDCFFQGEMDYIVTDTATYFFGDMIGLDADKDTCLYGYVYLEYKGNIELLQPRVPTAKEQALALKQQVFKDMGVKDSAVINIFTKAPQEDTLDGKSSHNLQAKTKEIIINLFDYDQEDDDVLSIYINDDIALNNYRLVKSDQIIRIPLTDTQQVAIKIKIISEGFYPPCSAQIIIQDGTEIHYYKLLGRRNEEIILNIAAPK